MGEHQTASEVLRQKREKFAKLSVGHAEYAKVQAEVDEAQRLDDEVGGI